jgi:hypothetical protein
VTNGMRWVGIDLHRRRSRIASIDDDGELTLSRRIVNDRDTFTDLLGDPDSGRYLVTSAVGNFLVGRRGSGWLVVWLPGD